MRELKEYFISEIGKMENTVIHGVRMREVLRISSAGCSRGTERGSAAYTGGQGNLCIVRISMCFKPSGSQRSIKRNWAAREYLDATIRISMSEFTTKEEIDYLLETLYKCVPMLRRYTRH